MYVSTHPGPQRGSTLLLPLLRVSRKAVLNALHTFQRVLQANVRSDDNLGLEPEILDRREQS